MSTLKARLEEIWRDAQVRCPWHQTWWHDNGPEIKTRHAHQEDHGLFWSHGKKVKPPDTERK